MLEGFIYDGEAAEVSRATEVIKWANEEITRARRRIGWHRKKECTEWRRNYIAWDEEKIARRKVEIAVAELSIAVIKAYITRRGGQAEKVIAQVEKDKRAKAMEEMERANRELWRRAAQIDEATNNAA